MEAAVILDHRWRRGRKRQLRYALDGLAWKVRINPRDPAPQTLQEHDVGPDLALGRGRIRRKLAAVDVSPPAGRAQPVERRLLGECVLCSHWSVHGIPA